ncbi:hypothetical protein HC024_15625 [Methylococcaceae bacterium WWC4]|uniref:VPLPA-CTERM sorting domain-containing protein n=1 Tax=Methylomonas sp. LWB TaxID=1905845 RepID=UPI0008DB21C1|nr:VPLPA-CTERM sorting domain-containing protein [Methylomonas sp. LWB]NJA07144.1 hypothetical protein [Methylococcaceae bacterium WWC4]OHX37963.1 hypothetical protein BJL95_06670 [Methylomonas sp. LWB]
MKFLYLIVLSLTLAATSAHGATVSGGSLIINIDRDAFENGIDLDRTAAPSIYVEEYYDASLASKTFEELRDYNTPVDLTDYAANEIPATGLKFTVNGAHVADNPLGRHNSATTFTFDPNDITGTASGSIGLAGGLRYRVDVAPPTNRVLMGDMTLTYNPAEALKTPESSDWVIYNTLGFKAVAFELFNVVSEINGNVLSLSGELGYGWGFDHLGAGPARNANARIGTFSFQTSVVPLPAAVWMFMTGLIGMGVSGFRNRSA